MSLVTHVTLSPSDVINKVVNSFGVNADNEDEHEEMK